MPPYSHAAFLSYQRFLLSNYQLEIEGLYLRSGHFYIHFPEFTRESVNGQGENLFHWFEQHKILGVPISIAAAPPAGAVKVDLEKFKDIIGDSPKLLVQKDLSMEAELLVPKGFPDFQVSPSHNGVVTLIFAEPVSEGNSRMLKKIFEQQRFLFPIEITHGPLPAAPKPLPDVFAYLSTYREIKGKLGKSLANAMEKDEDLWLETRSTILKGPANDQPFQKNNGLSCLVDGRIVLPSDLRNYLSIYDRVGIIIPQKDHFDEFLQALGADETELQELALLDRVEFFAPKALSHYPVSFLNDLTEARPESVHLSRSITAHTIREVRARNPLFYPNVGLQGQRLLLQELQEIVNNLPSDVRSTAAKALSDLGEYWVSMPTTGDSDPY